MNYYNEFDRDAAAWLRQLITAGLIPPGDVDERSITEIKPDELYGYTQCHFFAGIGGWSLALQLAGWPSTRPVWTGSCPCQPFSSAGKRKGTGDERHLWPDFRDLIGVCRPAIVFGEQVASKDGREWLAGIRADMEILGYAAGSGDLCAAGIGAPHIRQRIYWGGLRMADTEYLQHPRSIPRSREEHAANCKRAAGELAGRGGTGGMADTEGQRSGQGRQDTQRGGEGGRKGKGAKFVGSGIGGVGNTEQSGLEGLGRDEPNWNQPRWVTPIQDGSIGTPCCNGNTWSQWEPIRFADGKTRRIKPGLVPLVNGLSGGVVRSRYIGMAVDTENTAEARSMRIKGYGNAIVPQLAAIFIEEFDRATADTTTTKETI